MIGRNRSIALWSGSNAALTDRVRPQTEALNREVTDHEPGAVRLALVEYDNASKGKTGIGSSLALSNMRALVIITVLAFHSVLAYLWLTRSCLISI
jgi:hypothetical protein